ncbi:hypothetical protein JQ616_37565 [Bradyrhizobium tropiciagri]|uniref:hypothetical protein n=1 Tax=Bradyrhizobium tropiciagri TaxID=312253 RepID=UPI001BAA498C|nr:hypothetical protein [Bradyrhizobium tropiciagri]MBR0900695.1 hypothetical protein [Bradyrhizobium tropiciagri]
MFWEQVRYGQGICEDAGGYDWRCWCAALSLPFRQPTFTYSGYVAAGEDAKIGAACRNIFTQLGAGKGI